MENEFVPYEIALALKELGFRVDCLGEYILPVLSEKHIFRIKETNKHIPHQGRHFIVNAPLYQQAFRWFLREFQYLAKIDSVWKVINEKTEIFYGATYKNIITNENFNFKLCNSQEEAELACLIKLIEIVKNKK